MTELSNGECRHCGENRPGRERWMFYSLLGNLPGLPIERQFVCRQCWRVMQMYMVVGFTLLGILVGSLVGVTVWLTW